VTAAPPGEPPRVLGRAANRILVAGLLISLAALVALILGDSDWLFAALVAVALFGLLLFVLPLALFLYYSLRPSPPEVTPRMRRAVVISAGVLALGGALLAWGSMRDESATAVAAGIVVAAIGVATIVRAMRFTAPAQAVTRLDYGRSSLVGALCFFIVVTITPKFACGCGSKSKAYRAQLRGDLHDVVLAEEAYFADHHRYAARAELGDGFAATTNDSIVIVPADSRGYAATGTHAYLPDVGCGIWSGVRPADGMHGAAEGAVTCWDVR
jgi:hypothetical protein